MNASAPRTGDSTSFIGTSPNGKLGPLEARSILGMRVDVTSYEDAAERIVSWARSSQSRYVCVATVNNVMQAHDDPGFLELMNAADLVTPDGMPLVWGLRLLGVSDAKHVRGPALTPVICERAAKLGVPVGFYGGMPVVLDAMAENLTSRYPGLGVAYRFSPPFRPLTSDDEDRVVREINASGAKILFVGLGTPKQDVWMAQHRGRVGAAMVGVGAAFDLLAGVKREAPPWIQNLGLEWLFRLAHEPKRLWKRYLTQNPRFVVLFFAQLTRQLLRHGGRPTSFPRSTEWRE